MNAGDWVWSDRHHEAARVVEAETLWGESFYRVWLPASDVVARVRMAELRPVSQAAEASAAHVAYVAAAARVVEALARDAFLAPVISSVIPLPHQLQALSRALARDPVRCLLADEVGLGKTIEAGLILRELKLRGLVRRALVVAPKGLVAQWVAELRVHFGEEFQLLTPADAGAFDRVAHGQNLWRTYDQVICSMDAVKPLETRRGWSRRQVDDYNRTRLDDLVAAGWDLVIVDEAHRLAGSTDLVARYRLGQALAAAAPYLLLLSATPHQGKTDAFHRLMALLDPLAFPDVGSVSRERVRPYVIRTEKRGAVDAHGGSLFKPRHTRLVAVAWEEEHHDQRLLYDAVTDYVREGYNQALAEKKPYIGFLMTLMQRLVASSTRAIRAALERRLDALAQPVGSRAALLAGDDWADLGGEEQAELLLSTGEAARANECAEVALLLDVARRTEARGPDAKAAALLDWIYRLQQEETAPDLKILVFTEFVPTQEMLREFLTARGIPCAYLNGSMDLDERGRVQAAFAGEARVLISTDAGGEGLNLQFCHVVVNYDIPWNPMRLEQRVGRVDRIGQSHPVRALNFVYEETVEYRVRDVLEEKLAVILKEYGVDKLGDVLDSGEAGALFDNVYAAGIRVPEAVDGAVAAAVDRVRGQLIAVSEGAMPSEAADPLDLTETRRLLEHPLPHWIERMTLAYLESHGGRAEARGRVWSLTWPDGETMDGVTFSPDETLGSGAPVSLDHPRIRALVARLPLFVPGQPIARLALEGLPADAYGHWSLWRVGIDTATGMQSRLFPLFRHDNGRIFVPAARRIWELLLSREPASCGYMDGQQAQEAFAALRDAAEAQGQPIYQELVQAHQERLEAERHKGDYAFAARRAAIERLGLPEVRAHRLVILDREEREWRGALAARANATPELRPLLIVGIAGDEHG